MAALVIVAVAAAGLLQTETARVWMFMLPVVMLFVGEELAAWSPRCRTIVYVLLWTVAAVIIQNMQFVDVSN
jgi:hypothetical protein